MVKTYRPIIKRTYTWDLAYKTYVHMKTKRMYIRFHQQLGYTISTDDQYWSTQHDSTRNSSRGQNRILLFVLFMWCCIHQEPLVILQTQYVEHHIVYGIDGMLIILNINNSPWQYIWWCWFNHKALWSKGCSCRLL